jgi:hypothetical protein
MAVLAFPRLNELHCSLSIGGILLDPGYTGDTVLVRVVGFVQFIC